MNLFYLPEELFEFCVESKFVALHAQVQSLSTKVLASEEEESVQFSVQTQIRCALIILKFD